MDIMATKTSKLITVALVEDDDRIRRTVAMILDRAGDCRCVAQYGTGEAAMAGIPALAPQVIIMDINLPGISGVDCVRQLVELGVTSHVLMLTVHKDSDVIFDALAAGAGGYLVKPVPAEQLLAAVRDIYGGGAPMTSSIARKVVQSFKSATPERVSDDLSPREHDILDLLAQGCLYKEIADKLDSSYSTVRTHIEHIYEKLHVNSRSQAVAKSLHR
jgi:DNA-binding NarL/FixJ family response regulator